MDNMKKNLIVIIGLIITVLFFSGCVEDRDGIKVCKNSYNNLKLNWGYQIMGHQSDFLCCTENRFMVSYLIFQPNSSGMLWIHDFIYCSDTDELFYYGDSEYVERTIN